MTEDNKGPDAGAFPILPDELTVMVARAIHEQDRDSFGAYCWEALDKNECAWYFDVAAAVIKALQPHFQAVRRATIEECAKRIDEYAAGLVPEFGVAADWIASAIRALAKEGEDSSLPSAAPQVLSPNGGR